MKKNNTQNTYIDCSTQIPTESKTPDFHKNGWISPSGEFYGFDGALADSEKELRNDCNCIDCGGENSYHDSTCSYMLELTKE